MRLRLMRLVCLLFGHRPVVAALGWCPAAPPGSAEMVWAVGCARCRRGLPGWRVCDLHGSDCPR